MIIAKAVAAVVLPLSAVTPGATNPAVTQANIQQTICKANYTATIRPPASYTTKLKISQLAGAYMPIDIVVTVNAILSIGNTFRTDLPYSNCNTISKY